MSIYNVKVSITHALCISGMIDWDCGQIIFPGSLSAVVDYGIWILRRLFTTFSNSHVLLNSSLHKRV